MEFIDRIKNCEEHYSEENRKASDEYANATTIAYLAGKRDAMTELLKLMKEE